MTRRRYLVGYDIREDERLRRVAKLMRSYGHRLQYSLFVCDLDGPELFGLKADLAYVVNQSADSIVLVDLGETAGRGKECFEFIGHRKYNLPSSGPVIW